MCCNNRIWVEDGDSTHVQVFARKGSSDTGVTLTREDAIDFAFEILRKLMPQNEIAELAISRIE